MSSRNGYNKQWYEDRKRKGLCIMCENGIAAKNVFSCPSCREKLRLKRLRSIENSKGNGICTGCANVAVVGKVLCQTCLDKDKLRTKIRLQNKKDNGICVRCPNNAIPGFIHCQKCREKARSLAAKRKQIILDHYGQKCNCKCGCNVTKRNHLTVDHVNNDGHIHRKEVGFSIYRWIIKNNFPKDLQILCWNCNCAKQQYGGCEDEDMTAIRPNRLKKKRGMETPMPEVTPTHPNFI